MAQLTRPGVVGLLGVLLVFVPWTISAQTPQATAPPTLTAPVNDYAKVIDAASANELDRTIRALQTASGDVIVVATIQTLAPYGTIEEAAASLFEQAGIGTRAKDNGALILVAVEDRKVRIEVGYGLEEFITDGYAGDVIRTHMLPAFREGAYGPGLVAATRMISWRLADARGVSLDEERPVARRRERTNLVAPGGISTAVIAFLVWLFINWVNSKFGGGSSGFTRRGGRGTWSGWHGGVGGFGGGFGSGGFKGGGGFGGGGFGGFGGGRSGGGGASGGW
jgi:uncharacterized protein